MPSPSGGLLFLLVIHIVLGTPNGDWSDCPSACKCKWTNGRKLADCQSASLTAIPDNLSEEIQVLELNYNNFETLPSNAFKEVKLIHIQKLYLRKCNIRYIQKDAFRGLEIMIELDLSHNHITLLSSLVFRENIKLRVLNLNNNEIEKIENSMFSNHSFLQNVNLNHNKVLKIESKTFSNTPKLTSLNLSDNRLTYLKLSIFASLDSLKDLILSNNPWKCDCKLRQLRDWVIEKSLNVQQTTCSEPDRLENKLWSEISSEEFACRPRLILESSTIAAYPGGNITIACRAEGGDPPPEMHWTLNSMILKNSTRPSHGGYKQRYVLNRGESRHHLGEFWTWYNLTIIDVKHYDSGKYSCGARNPGGIAEEILTLGVRESKGGFLITGETNTLWTWLVALIIAAFVLFVFVLILCYCLCQRSKKRHNTNNVILAKKHEQSNGDININGEDDPEKALITKINPLQKPPRRLESSTQSSLNGSQGADIGRETTINNVVRTPGSGDQIDEPLIGRSYEDDDDTKMIKPMRKLQTPDHHDGYPPDLLAFPPRGHDSPAGSSTSTAPDSTRLPLQLPLHQAPRSAGFGTLPYNRSHSPFSPVMMSSPSFMGSCGSLPIVNPRQGYVTIPRRPRAPSWAAPPRPGDPLLKLDPIYDNLGPRTTADGSSLLSINKAGEGEGTLPRASTPNRLVRPMPMSNTLPSYYAPIEEVPSPAPTRHEFKKSPNQDKSPPRQYATNPRNSLTSPSRQLTSPINRSITPTKRATTPTILSPTRRSTTPTLVSPTRRSTTPTLLSPTRRATTPTLVSPNKRATTPIILSPTKRATTPTTQLPIRPQVKKPSVSPRSTSLIQNNNNNNNEEPIRKVPPKVPPKPKKKQINGDGNYEEDGEDGTEV